MRISLLLTILFAGVLNNVIADETIQFRTQLYYISCGVPESSLCIGIEPAFNIVSLNLEDKTSQGWYLEGVWDSKISAKDNIEFIGSTTISRSTVGTTTSYSVVARVGLVGGESAVVKIDDLKSIHELNTIRINGNTVIIGDSKYYPVLIIRALK